MKSSGTQTNTIDEPQTAVECEKYSENIKSKNKKHVIQGIVQLHQNKDGTLKIENATITSIESSQCSQKQNEDIECKQPEQLPQDSKPHVHNQNEDHIHNHNHNF